MKKKKVLLQILELLLVGIGLNILSNGIWDLILIGALLGIIAGVRKAYHDKKDADEE